MGNGSRFSGDCIHHYAQAITSGEVPMGKNAVYVIAVTILGIWVSAPCEKFTLKLSGMNVFFSTVIRSMALTRYKNIFSFFLSVSQV